MLKITIRKIIKNKWLSICLFLGCLLSVSLMSGLSAYARAVTQRMLIGGFEQNQAVANPLNYSARYSGTGFNKTNDEINNLDYIVTSELYPGLDLSSGMLRRSLVISNANYRHISLLTDDIDEGLSRFALTAMQNFNENIVVIGGRLPAAEPANGEYEAIISRQTMYSQNLALGSRYQTGFDLADETNYITVRIVGIFEQKDANDPYWFQGPSNRAVFLDYQALYGLVLQNVLPQYYDVALCWDYALDYRALKADDAERFLNAFKRQEADKIWDIGVSLTSSEVIETFLTRRRQLSLFLLVLQVPIISLIIFFTVMISGIIIDHDRPEMSLLKSRGAGKSKIILLYAYQSLMIALPSLVIGIPFSLYLCGVLGSANSFLEFANRSSLEITLHSDSVLYALAGVAVFVASMLVPVIFISESSVVSVKRKRARPDKPFYERYFLDIMVFAISLVGLYSYNSITEVMSAAELSAKDAPINPVLFLISSLFILGCGLLFARLYPYLIRLFFRLGQKSWSPVMYAVLVNASRARARSRFIMVFLVLTMALGIFSSAAARTINRNGEDRLMYGVGAEVKLKERWPSIDPDPEFTAGVYVEKPEMDLVFTEPSFEKYTSLEGVKGLTKVYGNDRGQIRAQKGALTNVNVICVVPHEFAGLSWSRKDIYPYHINHLMNAMTTNPNAVIVSKGLLENLGLDYGDYLELTWKNNDSSLSCVVYDSIDYFPTYYPEMGENLIIVNYDMMSDFFRKEPYEIWMSLEDGFTPMDIYDQLMELKVPLIFFSDSHSQIAGMKNDPFIQSMNGNMTLSFIITIVVTMTGFLIFWIFDLKGRQLQLGIMRSIGLPRRGVIAMLLWEQILMSFAPALAGFLIGGVSANIFVPMFELGVEASKAVPPFVVYSLISDYVRVGVIVMFFILLAVAALGAMSARINITQALKLGED